MNARQLTAAALALSLLAGCRKEVAVEKAGGDETAPGEQAAADDAAFARLLRQFKDTGGQSRVRAIRTLVSMHKNEEMNVIPAVAALAGEGRTDGPGVAHPDEPSSTMEAVVLVLQQLGPKGEAALSGEALPKLRKNLKATGPAVREHAANAIRRMGPKAVTAIEDIITCLADADGSVRRAAYGALGALGTPPARPVVELLAHADAGVRLDAAEAVSKLVVPPETLPTLMKALGDADPFVRDVAAGKIGGMGDRAAAAVPQLVAAVKLIQVNDLKNARRIANLGTLEALRRIGPPAVLPLAELLDAEGEATRFAAAATLGRMGPTAAAALPRLEARMRSEQKFAEVAVEAAVAQVLIGAKPEGPVGYLVGLLDNPRAAVRALACGTLSRLGKNAAGSVPKLVQMLADPEDAVRQAAIGALKTMGPAAKSALAVLGPRLTDDQLAVRTAAAEIVRAMGPTAADIVPDLAAALGVDDGNVRRLVTETLLSLGPKAAKAVPELAKVASDKDAAPYARALAAQALGAIGPAARDAAPVLLELLALTDPTLREAVARALGRIDPPADAAVPRLLTLAQKDGNASVRVAAILALGHLGPKAAAATEPLKVLFADNSAPADRKVAVAAALARLDPAKKAEYLESAYAALRDRSDRPLSLLCRRVALEAADLLSADLAPVVPDIVELTRSKNPDQQARAARALGLLPEHADASVPALTAMLKSADGRARRAAAEALEKLGPKAKAAGARLRDLAQTDRDNADVAARAAEAVDPGE